MNIEQELKEMDFSGLSKIKENLFEKLMEDRSRRVEMTEDDLDFLAAASNKILRPDSEKDLK